MSRPDFHLNGYFGSVGFFGLVLTFLFGVSASGLAELQAQETPRAPGTLRIESPRVATSIRLDGEVQEFNPNEDTDLKEKSLRLEGELRFFENFSLGIQAGIRREEIEGSDTRTYFERPGLSIRYIRPTGGLFWGGGLRLFNKHYSREAVEGEDPTLYRIRPMLLLGLVLGELELAAEAHYQSQTNQKFKEDLDQEFRRHYQLGLSASFGLGKHWRIHTETEYRLPYDKNLDAESRFWNFYPGISYNFSGGSRINLYLSMPVLTRSRNLDRGAGLGIYLHFD